MEVIPGDIGAEMTPMTTRERTDCESRNASNGRPASSALRCRHPVSRLELRRIDDLHVRERLLGLRVLGHQHRRRTLLPVRALAEREADPAVPPPDLPRPESLGPHTAVVTT